MLTMLSEVRFQATYIGGRKKSTQQGTPLKLKRKDHSDHVQL